MNAISEFIESLLSGDGITVGHIAYFFLIWLIYRVGGKHIDELYSRIRNLHSPKLDVGVLQSELIDSQRETKEARKTIFEYRRLASRSLTASEEYQGLCIRLQITNETLFKENLELRAQIRELEKRIRIEP